MEDVALRAGVSRALVSLVMRDSPKVSERSKDKVLRAANELGYRPNLMARNLAEQKSMTIGVVLNDLHNPFFAEIADGIISHAHDAGYRLIFNSGQRDPEAEHQAISTFLEFRTDAVIAVGAQLGDEALVWLANADRTPIVVVGRSVASERIDSINTDDRLGAAIVVNHLVGLGHKRIAHIDGGDGAGAAARRDGYQGAMERHGLGEHVTVVPGAFTEAAGVDGANLLLDSDTGTTAVFAANDLCAIGALDQIRQRNWRVPSQLSLVGFDNTAIASLSQFGLTTIDQPRNTMGKLAAKAAIERLQGRTRAIHEVLTPKLVERSTTAVMTQ